MYRPVSVIKKYNACVTRLLFLGNTNSSFLVSEYLSIAQTFPEFLLIWKKPRPCGIIQGQSWRCVLNCVASVVDTLVGNITDATVDTPGHPRSVNKGYRTLKSNSKAAFKYREINCAYRKG